MNDTVRIKNTSIADMAVGKIRFFSQELKGHFLNGSAQSWNMHCTGVAGEVPKKLLIETDFIKASQQIQEDLRSVDKVLSANMMSMFARASIYQQALVYGASGLIGKKDKNNHDVQSFKVNLAFIIKTIKDEKPIAQIVRNIDAYVAESFAECDQQIKLAI